MKTKPLLVTARPLPLGAVLDRMWLPLIVADPRHASPPPYVWQVPQGDGSSRKGRGQGDASEVYPCKLGNAC